MYISLYINLESSLVYDILTTSSIWYKTIVQLCSIILGKLIVNGYLIRPN